MKKWLFLGLILMISCSHKIPILDKTSMVSLTVSSVSNITFTIKDGNEMIGTLGNSGILNWERKVGTMELSIIVNDEIRELLLIEILPHKSHNIKILDDGHFIERTNFRKLDNNWKIFFKNGLKIMKLYKKQIILSISFSFKALPLTSDPPSIIIDVISISPNFFINEGRSTCSFLCLTKRTSTPILCNFFFWVDDKLALEA